MLDDRALLYDQAFALLGLAAAAMALDARGEFERRAVALRGAIESRLGTADGSLRSEAAAEGVRESNPHMHLLEACLAWAEIGTDAGWAAWVRRLAELAVSRFIRKDSGALRETALRLLAIGDRYGVHRGVAINQLLDDFTVTDPDARFWPQTERLKSALLAATLTGEPRYWSMALAAATSFFPYLATSVPGLWFDVQRPDGSFIDSPAPASTFYHLVGAIVALNTALRSPA
jgi:mannose-6-phosphate isomerase